MICIRQFSEIVVRRRMLILCDIDDTILDYGKKIKDYWDSKIDDPGYRIWISIIEQIIPRITDERIHNFFNDAKEKECDIHFITHRNELFSYITHKHLSDFGITGIPVHFLTGSSKSEYINRTFNLNEYDGLIFIDDSQHNIDDVYNNVIKCDVYKFIKK